MIYIHFVIKKEWKYGAGFFIETAKREFTEVCGGNISLKNLPKGNGFEVGFGVLKLMKMIKYIKADHIRSMFHYDFAF